MALTLTYIGTPAPVTIGSAADITFPAVSIGTAAADRWVLCVFWDLGDNQVPSGASIQGITATILYDPATAPHSPYWFIAKVPTLTQGDITIHTPGTQAGTGTVSVYTINGVPNLTPAGTAYFTGTGTSFNTVGINVTTKAGGVVVESFLNTKAAGAPAMTWNANSPAMTSDMVNTAISTTNYMNTRSRAVATAGTQDGGNFSNNLTGTIRVSALSIAEQVNADTATALTSFSGVTQVVTVKESMPSTIAQTLTKLSQSVAVTVVESSAIATVLPKLTQDFEANVNNIDATTIDQTLPGITQEIDVNTNNATIDQTLFGITQSITALMVPNADIAQTLSAFVQSLTVSAAPRVDTSIDQTLPAFSSQALNVVESMPTHIIQTLPGFVQEMDDTEIITATVDTVLCRTTGTLDVAFVTHRESTSSASPQTFSGIDFGVANPNLWVVVALAYGTDGIRVPSGVKIGGLTATKLCRSIGAAARCVDIWYANVPAGGVGDVQATFGSTNNGSIGVWTIRGALDTTSIPFDTGNGASYNPILPARAGAVGFLVGCSAGTFTFIDPATADYQATEAVSTSYKHAGSHEAISASGWAPAATNTGGSLTNYAAAVFMPAIGVTPALSQQLNMDVSTGSRIDQTLRGFTQSLNVSSITAHIDQTLRTMTQSLSGTVVEPPNVIAHLIDITLPTFTQEIDVTVSPNADIDQTLLGISQEIDITTIPNVEAFIDLTFEGLTQRIIIVEEFIATIDTVLPFSIQQVAIVEEFTGTIDQTLRGFTQEIDIVETIVTHIDQTLPGFTQDFEGFVEEPEGVIAGNIVQTLPGFTQEIDVSALKIDIAVELQGIRQRIDVTAPSGKKHQRAPHAVAMPSKDMPIHPGELELFRRKVYGRAVDAMVPPPIIARNNLTTQRHPTSRPVVNRTPLGKKPS